MLLASVCAGLACNGSDGALEASIRQRVTATDGETPFCMSEIATFDWDTLFLFQPYTSARQMEEMLGFAWPDASRVDLSSDEVSAVLVFVKDQRVVRHLKMNRRGADFAQRYGIRELRLPRAGAAFEVVRKDDWTYVDIVSEEKRGSTPCP